MHSYQLKMLFVSKFIDQELITMYKGIKYFGYLLAIVLFSYVGADAQVVNATKKVVNKTKDATVDAAKKTVEVTKDAAEKT